MRLRPALFASVGLHAAAILAAFFVLPRTAHEIPQPMGAPVPVTLIPDSLEAPPVPAPEPTPAATPEPVPDASTEAPGEEAPPAPSPPPQPAPEPEPAPPEPVPRLTPPRPAPRPTPPRPTPPRPTPPRETPRPAPRPTPRPTPPPAARPEPAPPERSPPRPTPPRRERPQRPAPSLDLDAIARSAPNRPTQRPSRQASLDLDSIAAAAPRPGPRRSSAQQGETRERAGPTGRTGSAGRSEETALALGAISDRVQRAWNLDCATPGFSTVRVRVTVNLNRDGSLAGEPRSDVSTDEGGVLGVAAQRALTAVRRAAPFDTLPDDRYSEWRSVVLNFNAREACRGRT